jgi:hypothetical protein
MKITITRAQNGWILEEEREYEHDEGTYLAQEVFTDEPHENEQYSSAYSLANVIWAGFELYFQSKWNPGLALEVYEKGTEEEFMEEYAKERAAEEAEEEELCISLPPNDEDDPVEAFKKFYPEIKGRQMPETD